jgi:energy-coupling factor transport system ATP-binding protein
MMDALALRGLSFAYRSYNGTTPPKRVLDCLDLSLAEGSKTLILSPPDGGKSTLSHIICGLVPKYLEGDLEGSCLLQGVDVQSCEPWDLMEKCILVGQNPQEQLLMTTCSDELAFPLESLGVQRSDMVRSVRNALRIWNLLDFGQANPQEMSGGERKRLLLATLDVVPSPLWILDEPFDDLDGAWRETLMARIVEHQGTVLVFSSRYLDEFRGVFDQYGILFDGKIGMNDEQETVIAYDALCDREFSSMEGPIEERSRHVLEVSDLSLVHPRRSVTEEIPFMLEAPAFRLESEEIVALVGPNGSGKSTFSRALCGLDPTKSGAFQLDGMEMGRKDLSRIVGYVFQNPDYEIFLPTVREELAWSLRGNRRLSIEEKNALVADCAHVFHLDPEDNPSTMSYGGRKQLQAAVHYLLDRPFYILDELDSGVTYAAAFEMIGLLRRRGAGILLITHDRSFSNQLAQRSYAIHEGVVTPLKESR